MVADMESPSRFRLPTSTLLLLGATLILAIAASLVGISDNPPGIALLYGAGLTFALAIAHRWASPKKFGLLFLGSLVGFFIMVVIHNFAEVGAHRISNLPVLAFLLSAISVIGFIAAVIICPMTGLVGAIGWIATLGKLGKDGT
jgi:hypothetical protein